MLCNPARQGWRLSHAYESLSQPRSPSSTSTSVRFCERVNMWTESTSFKVSVRHFLPFPHPHNYYLHHVFDLDQANSYRRSGRRSQERDRWQKWYAMQPQSLFSSLLTPFMTPVLITGVTVGGLGFEAAYNIGKYANALILVGSNLERCAASFYMSEKLPCD